MFENLAELGKLDLELSQLRYRLDSSPEIIESNNLKSQIGDLQGKLDSINTAMTDIHNNESDLEAQQEKLNLRIRSLENETKINSSLSYRDQEAVAAELVSLQHQLEELIEEELHLLEKEELLSEERSHILEKLNILQNEKKSLEEVISVHQKDITIRIREIEFERDSILKQLVPDVAEVYKNLRTRYQDSCVAVIEAGKCSGCHLKLSASEIEICKRNSGVINYCEQCGRILLYN